MTTIEGGAICTNDDRAHDVIRMFRSHGMTREASEDTRREYQKKYPDLNPLFTFAVPGYNVRSTELNAVIGLSQLKRLDDNIKKRTENLHTWIESLDKSKFQTEFQTRGSSNFSLPLILVNKDLRLFKSVQDTLVASSVEYRVGTAGGGCQARQPYLEKFVGQYREHEMPNLNHIHEYGLYVGNHPEISHEQIIHLCEKLNTL